MPILKLAELQTGDVLLEPGDDTIAQETGLPGDRFGHASLVVTRLLRIEAPGPGGAVQIDPFAIEVWECDNKPRVTGVFVEDGSVVLRPKASPDAANIVAEAQWEGGYGYADIAKLKTLKGLTDRAKNLLNNQRAQSMLTGKIRGPVPLERGGRSCGELVARVLFSDGEVMLTPNGLYRDPRLRQLGGVIIDDGGWQRIAPPPEADELKTIFKHYNQRVARDTWQDLIAATAPRRSKKKIAAEIERLVDERLTSNLQLIMQANCLADKLFAA